MTMQPISETVYEMLVRQGLRLHTVGAVADTGIKMPGAAMEARTGEVAADVWEGGRPTPAYELRNGKRSPIRLIVSNTNTRQTARKGTASLVSVRP